MKKECMTVHEDIEGSLMLERAIQSNQRNKREIKIANKEQQISQQAYKMSLFAPSFKDITP